MDRSKFCHVWKRKISYWLSLWEPEARAQWLVSVQTIESRAPLYWMAAGVGGACVWVTDWLRKYLLRLLLLCQPVQPIQYSLYREGVMFSICESKESSHQFGVLSLEVCLIFCYDTLRSIQRWISAIMSYPTVRILKNYTISFASLMVHTNAKFWSDMDGGFYPCHPPPSHTE